MDKAFVGACHVGFTRATVYRPDWDVMLTRHKQVDSRNGAFVDYCRVDHCRATVFRADWDVMLERLKK